MFLLLSFANFKETVFQWFMVSSPTVSRTANADLHCASSCPPAVHMRKASLIRRVPVAPRGSALLVCLMQVSAVRKKPPP
jgi:hypothetical protein